MHFHLPKPLHGWREFVGEVGIIVIGVLIALGAEQAVERWQWHEKVAIVRRSLMGELGNDRARWQENMTEAACMRAEIDQLGRWADSGGAKAAEPRAPVMRGGGMLWMHSANWGLATNSQTLDHFPIDDQLAFAALYDGIAHREVDLEAATTDQEKVMVLLDSSSDPEERRKLQTALDELKWRLMEVMSNDAYMNRHFDALGIKADDRDFAADLPRESCGSEKR